MSKETRTIEVVPYDPRWQEQFGRQADQIKGALARNCLAIHHVGSTSVPSLAAKPKIDIIVATKRPLEVRQFN